MLALSCLGQLFRYIGKHRISKPRSLPASNPGAGEKISIFKFMIEAIRFREHWKMAYQCSIKISFDFFIFYPANHAVKCTEMGALVPPQI